MATADLLVNYNPKVGYAVVELLSVTKGSDSAFTSTVEAVPNTSQAYYPTANSVAISATGIVTGTPTLDIDFQWWDSSSSTWKQETYPVILQIVTNSSVHSSTSDNLTLTLTGTSLAEQNITYSPKTGWDVTEVSGVATGIVGTYFENFTGSVIDGSQICAPDTISFTATGIITTSVSTDTLTQFWDKSDSTWKQVTLLVNSIHSTTHGTASDNLTLITSFNPIVAESLHTHTAPNLTLVTNNTVIVSSPTHIHSVPQLTIVARSPKVIAQATHLTSCDNLTLTAYSPINAIHSATHATTSGVIDMSTWQTASNTQTAWVDTAKNGSTWT